MSECDHIIGHNSGGGPYRVSDLTWCLYDSFQHYRFCPICGHQHDWNEMLEMAPKAKDD